MMTRSLSELLYDLRSLADAGNFELLNEAADWIEELRGALQSIADGEAPPGVAIHASIREVARRALKG